MNLKKMEQYWYLKVIGLILALVGIFWAQSALQKSIQPEKAKPAETQELPDSIPAKVEIGK